MEKLEFPNRITVELTNQCNVSCSFCPRQKVNMKMGYMDMNLYQKIIDEASSHLPVKLVIFFRGESLLHPYFVECLQYAKEKGIGPIQFATNGLALDGKTADQILDAGIDFISFSLDTLDPDIYKSTRKHGDLTISTKNIIGLSNKCKERKSNGFPVPILQVSTIELDDYIDGQEAFINFWKQYVDIVRVYYEHDEKGRFRNSSVQQALSHLNQRQPCRKVFTDMLIYWDGSLALCNYDWEGGIDLNINEMSLFDAWHSASYEKIRKMHNENTLSPDVMCSSCEHWRIDYMPNGFLGKMYKNI